MTAAVSSGSACPWPAWETAIAGRHLMCPVHWGRLPAGIQARILLHYRRGQTAVTATPEYRDALRDAMAFARDTARQAAVMTVSCTHLHNPFGPGCPRCENGRFGSSAPAPGSREAVAW